jgi:hypothetical protein
MACIDLCPEAERFGIEPEFGSWSGKEEMETADRRRSNELYRSGLM